MPKTLAIVIAASLSVGGCASGVKHDLPGCSDRAERRSLNPQYWPAKVEPAKPAASPQGIQATPLPAPAGASSSSSTPGAATTAGEPAPSPKDGLPASPAPAAPDKSDGFFKRLFGALAPASQGSRYECESSHG